MADNDQTPKPPKKRAEITFQRILQWAVLGVVGYAILKSLVLGPGSEERERAGEAAESAQLSQVFAQFRELGVDASLLPNARPVVQVETVEEGSGVAARCGDTARIGLRPLSEEEARETEPLPSTEERRVTLGSGGYNIALEQGVVGMKEGGVARLYARPEISLRRDPLTEELQEQGRQAVQAMLHAVEPAEGEPAGIYSDRPITTGGAQCGETVHVGGRLYDGDWNLIGEWDWEEGMRANFILGENRWTGLERGLLGMTPGEKRLIVLTDRPAAGGIEAVAMPKSRAIFAELTRRTPEAGAAPAPETAPSEPNTKTETP